MKFWKFGNSTEPLHSIHVRFENSKIESLKIKSNKLLIANFDQSRFGQDLTNLDQILTDLDPSTFGQDRSKFGQNRTRFGQDWSWFSQDGSSPTPK